MEFYVSLAGNDTWSGALDNPNAAGTDGPFRTIHGAQAAVRAAPRDADRVVTIRGGTHYLESPLLMTTEDSGTAAHPVVYRAYPGEKAVISGGRPISGWQARGGGLWAAAVPDAALGKWEFRQLRVGDEMQVLARHPNHDPAHPTTGGWLFASPGDDARAWATSVVCIHTPGDWLEWEVQIPSDGQYGFWLYYGQHMKPYGRDNNDNCMTVQVDDADPVPLTNLPNTGAWQRLVWNRNATLTLGKGRHSIKWTNRKGGGINMNAFALCNDPLWNPQGHPPPSPAHGRHLVLVQAEAFKAAKCKEMRVDAIQAQGGRDELPFRPGDIPDWDVSGAQIMIFPAWGWVGGPVQVAGIDRDGYMLKLTGKNAQQDIRMGNRYYIQNVREALDSAGEFFLDRQAGQLLYMPKSDSFTQHDVVAPWHDRLIHVQGDASTDTWPEHIHLLGLAFRDAKYSIAVDSLYAPDDAAIWLDHARHILIENCTFSHLGGYAVHLRNRANHCQILSCTIREMGQGGVIARGETATQASDCTVAGCHMHDLGQVYKHVAGVYITTGSGHRVAHCTIHDVPRYAISFKSYSHSAASHSNIAEYNDLRRTNLETNDTGAIETLGRDRKPTANVIRYNLILDVVGMKHTPDGKLLTPYYTWGIYLDDYSSGTQVYGNIVARTVRGGYHNHLGFDNVVENNIFVDGASYQAEWNGREDMRRNTFSNNIVVYSNPDAVYIRSSGWTPEVLKACDNNVVWWTGGNLETADKAVTPAGTWEQWRALGFAQHSVVADPLFVDSEHDDYRLRPESPAFALGFKPIPVDKIGVEGYDKRAFLERLASER